LFFVVTGFLLYFSLDGVHVLKTYGTLPIFISIAFVGVIRGFISAANSSFMAQLVPRSVYGNAATWNAYSTDGFRAGLKAGKEPPVRQLYFTNSSFMKHTGVLNTVLSDNGFYKNKPLKVLVIGGEEGMSTLWLSNKLLRHDDSQLFCAGGFQKQNSEIFNFNTYFSKYYYKLNAIHCNDPTDLLVASCGDPDIVFDVVYISGITNIKDMVFNGTACISMLKNDGIIIFDNYDHPIVKAGVDIIENASDTISLYKGDIAVYTL
jgi:hypothetical protein